MQADTLIPNPGDVQSWDRYAGMANNPVRYVDPSGHIFLSKEEYIPALKIRGNIPSPKMYYPDCPGGWCGHAGHSPEERIAHVIYGESGSLLAAANVSQTLMNRAYNYWTCETCVHGYINPLHIPWKDIRPEELSKLLVFIASEPENDNMAYPDPAYDAWENPAEYNQAFYSNILATVSNMIQSAGVNPSSAPTTVAGIPPNDAVRNVSVMYFLSNTSDTPPSIPGRVFVHTDFVYDPSGGRYQHYYFTK